MLEREGPHRVAVGLRNWEIKVVDAAEMMCVGGADHLDDFSREVVGRKRWRRWYGDLILVGITVVCVEGKLAANGLCVAHQDGRLLAHAAVEAVHDVGTAVLVWAVNAKEIIVCSEPSGIGNFSQLQTVRGCLQKVNAEFALGRLHDGELRQGEVGLYFEQCLAVTLRREVIEDAAAPRCLFQRKVTHVGDQEDEFLLVVRPSHGFRGGFDEDDAGLLGWLLGERTSAVREAVVGNVNPAAVANIGGGWDGKERSAGGKEPCQTLSRVIGWMANPCGLDLIA